MKCLCQCGGRLDNCSTVTKLQEVKKTQKLEQNIKIQQM